MRECQVGFMHDIKVDNAHSPPLPRHMQCKTEKTSPKIVQDVFAQLLGSEKGEKALWRITVYIYTDE